MAIGRMLGTSDPSDATVPSRKAELARLRLRGCGGANATPQECHVKIAGPRSWHWGEPPQPRRGLGAEVIRRRRPNSLACVAGAERMRRHRSATAAHFGYARKKP